MRVFVTGGTGYVGQALVKELLKRGHSVTTLQRPGSHRPLQLPAHIVMGDLFSVDTLSRAMEQHDAVIHLVGIIREVPRRNITMHHIHVDGTKSVIAAAKRTGVRRLLHMSALGADVNATSAYHRSKGIAEQVVRESALDYTIFQPSVIWGEGGPGPEFIGQLRDLIHSAPVTPVIGHGRYRLQPVPMPMLCAAFCNALERSDSIQKTYEIGGPDVITYVEILEQLAKQSGKSLRALHIPAPLMRVVVSLLGRFHWFPITPDQFTMLMNENICKNSQEAVADLHLPQVPFHV